jgi:peptidoglycan hydrolase CwlO-like protein
VRKLKESERAAQTKCEALTAENAALHEQLTQLSNQNLALKRNISALYQTAKAELERKNEEIRSLRDELDHLRSRGRHASAGAGSK